jgi:hypothetical protein
MHLKAIQIKESLLGKEDYEVNALFPTRKYRLKDPVFLIRDKSH